MAYEYRDHNDNPLVFNTFDKTLAANPGVTHLFHSDRGYQYASKTFREKRVQKNLCILTPQEYYKKQLLEVA